jgi:hypothetical protein
MEIAETFETGCCPRFQAEKWNERTVNFDDKLFLRDRVKSFMHIPLNYGKVMKRALKKIKEAGAANPEPLVLTHDTSPWRSEIHIAVAKPVSGADMVPIHGTFLTKVFEGPYKDMGKHVKAMAAYVQSKGSKAKDFYFYYAYCPNCAKAYGKNYQVILAEV